jgi:hypothetical protein
MKKSILFAFSLCLYLPLSSQITIDRTGWSIAPFIGANVINSRILVHEYYRTDDYTHKTKFNAGVSFSHLWPSGLWFNTGIHYVQKGFFFDSLAIPPLANVWAEIDQSYATFHLPAELGYHFTLGPKIAIRPAAGLALGNNMAFHYVEIPHYPYDDFPTVPAAFFEYPHFTISLVADLSLTYILTDKTSLILSGHYISNSSRIVLRQGYDKTVRVGKLSEDGIYYSTGISIKL